MSLFPDTLSAEKGAADKVSGGESFFHLRFVASSTAIFPLLTASDTAFVSNTFEIVVIVRLIVFHVFPLLILYRFVNRA